MRMNGYARCRVVWRPGATDDKSGLAGLCVSGDGIWVFTARFAGESVPSVWDGCSITSFSSVRGFPVTPPFSGRGDSAGISWENHAEGTMVRLKIPRRGAAAGPPRFCGGGVAAGISGENQAKGRVVG